MKILILQHIACEPPGVYEDILVERGAAIRRVELDAAQQLPDWRGGDAILAMGGPMSVNDDDTLPWLSAENNPYPPRTTVPGMGFHEKPRRG